MEGDAGMGLQRLLVEKKMALYDSQKHGFFYFGEASLYLVSGGHLAKKQVAITY